MKERSKFRFVLLVLLLVAVCLLLTACSGSTDKGDSSDFDPTLKNCWACSIYGSVFLIANGLVASTIDSVISISKTILGIMLAFFLLIRIGSMMVFVAEDKMISTMKSTVFVFFKAMMVALVLTNSTVFLELVRDVAIYPMGQFLLMLSNAILDALPDSGRYFGGIVGITPGMGQLVVSGQLQSFDINASIFGDLGIQVQYTVARIFAALNSGFIFVRHMFALGGAFAIMLGIVMWWQLFNLVIVFPLAFAEAFIWLGFYVVLMPVCLVMWVFPRTEKYLTAFFPTQFLTPFLNVLFGCIISVLMVTLLQLYSDLALNGIFRSSSQESSSFLAESAAGGRPNIIILALICMMVRKIAMEIGDFTEKFGGEPSDQSFFTIIKKGVEKLKKMAVTAVTIVATGGAGAAGAIGRTAVKAAAKQALKAGAKAASGNQFSGGKGS